MQTTTWTLAVHITHLDSLHTEADAVLHTNTGVEIRHTGYATRRAQAFGEPDPGDALAVSRALSGLSRDLLRVGDGSSEATSAEQIADVIEWSGLG